MPERIADEIMTIEELSNYLKIPRSTLYKLVQSGKLPGQKIGKQWRFGKKSIDQWINDGSGNLNGSNK